MEFTFGQKVICDTPEVAKGIAFDKKISTVTLDGDQLDPAGSVTGGSKSSLGNLLLQIEDLAGSCIRQVGRVQGRAQELSRVEGQLTSMEGRQSEAADLLSNLELQRADML